MIKKIFNYKVILFIIFIAGFLLRFIFLNHYSLFFAEEGRDLLIARHIAKYGEFVLLGHNASGIGGLSYSPYYYYFLAFLTLISDNPYFLFFFVTIWHSLSIILVFYIGKNLINIKSGLIASLLYSFSLLMISTNNLMAAFLSLQFFILSFFFFSLYVKNKKNIYLYLHIFFIIFAFSIEYSIALIIPSFVIWVFYLNNKKIAQNKLLLFLKIVFLYIFPLLITFVPQLIYFGNKISLFRLNSDSHINLFTTALSRLSKLMFELISLLFMQNTDFFVFYCFLLMILFLFIKRKRMFFSLNELFIIFVPLVCFITTIIKSDVYTYYLLYLYIYVFLGIGVIIDKILEDKKLFLIILLFPIIIGVSPSRNFFDFNRKSELSQVYEVSFEISKIMKQMSINSAHQIEIIQGSGVDGLRLYFGPDYIYFLERILEKKLVNIDQSSLFGYFSNENPNYIFLICRSFYHDKDFNNCLNDFNNEFGNKYQYTKRFYYSSTFIGYLFTKVSD